VFRDISSKKLENIKMLVGGSPVGAALSIAALLAPRAGLRLQLEGLDAAADMVGPGIYGGRIERTTDGSVAIGRQFEEHNSLPGPIYAGGGFTEMSVAIHTGPDAVAELLSRDPSLVNEVTTGGASPLHVCGMSQRGQHSASVLLDAGADVDAIDTWGYTALQRMATNNLGAGAAALLRAGADRLRPSGLLGSGDSARELALRLRSFDVLKEIQLFEIEHGLPRPTDEPLLFTRPPPNPSSGAPTSAPAARVGGPGTGGARGGE
jgi:hypothetical protein